LLFWDDVCYNNSDRKRKAVNVMDERTKRIQEAIQKKGLSYAELERLTGVSHSALQRYASGKTKKIPIDVIEKIADVTGVTARYLMCWDEQETTLCQLKGIAEKMVTENAPNDKVRSAIIDKVNAMSDSQAKKFLEFLESMAE
jgi:transcriptional regulator with XRE-family HTH domain